MTPTQVMKTDHDNSFLDNGMALKLIQNAQLPILQQLLKLEHTYTLREQRTALPAIRGFGLLNAVVNACLMLASGFLSIGGQPMAGWLRLRWFF